MSLADELQNMSDEELGRLAAPSSEKLGFFSKLGNALAGRRGLGGDLFGTDSESIGRQIRSQLIAREAAADFDDKRSEKNKKREISLKYDANGDGQISFKEMPLTEQKRLSSEGQAPTKLEDFSDQILGPTRSIFDTVMAHEESNSGKVIPDEFGGTIESVEGQPLSPFGQNIMRKEGANLFDALTKGTIRDEGEGTRAVEDIVRRYDPSLQGSEEVSDPDGELSYSTLLQSDEAVSTDLRTPKSQRESLTSDTINPLLASMGLEKLPPGLELPPNVATTFLQQVGQQQGREFSQQKINDRQKERQTFSREERKARQKWTEEFTETKTAISAKSQLYVDSVIKERELTLMGADANNKAILEQQRSNNSLINSLEVVRANNEFDSQKAAIDETSKYFHNLLDGQQQLDGAFFQHTLKLAEERAKASKTETSVSDMFKTTVKETIQSNPALAREMTLALALLPPGSLPEESERLTRRAIADTINKYKKEQLAQGRASVILRGGDGTLGEDFSTTPAKAAALEAEILDVKAGRSSADMGTLMEALSFVQELDIDKTKDLTAKQEEDLAVATTMLNSVNIMKQTYDNAYTGKYGSALAEWRIAAAEGGRALGIPPSITDFVDLPEEGKAFFSESQALTKQLINLTGGLALTPMELQLVFATQPVIQNPNFRTQLDVFERNIMDLRDAREAARSGNEVEKQRIIDRISARSQDFISKYGGAEQSQSSKESPTKPFPSVNDARKYFDKESKKGRSKEDILEEINSRGVVK